MNERRDNFHLLTGASGSGKSTIVAALRRRGHLCVDEIGRQVVRQQSSIGGDATPWQDVAAFMALLLDGSIAAFRSVEERVRPVFFDRGIPEGISWARSQGAVVLQRYLNATGEHRYNPTVFVSPPWPEIYVNDAERRHSFEDGEAEFHRLIALYAEFGYRLVEVPKLAVEARVDFMLRHIGEAAP